MSKPTVTTNTNLVVSGTATISGGITASATQTINFGTNAPTMYGHNITSGTIPDNALSSNIPLKNFSNSFTGSNTFSNKKQYFQNADLVLYSYDSNYSTIHNKKFNIYVQTFTGEAVLCFYANSDPIQGIWLTYGTSAWGYNSDRRIKNNISSIENGRDIVNKLHPVSFYFNGNDNKQMGFIAQEVEEIIPEIVLNGPFNETIKDSVKGLNMNGIIPFLVKAVQEQDTVIKNLQNELNELKQLLKQKMII